MGPIERALRGLGVDPRRQRGQTFLADERVAEEIVDRSDIRTGDGVLEIGPGLGVLTFRLAERAGPGGSVTAVELEPAFVRYLRTEAERRGVTNLTIMEGDALTVDLPPVDRVVANLPYRIASPLLFRLLDHELSEATLMFQREFAERLLAPPCTRQRGAVTLKVELRAACTELLHVPARAFHPEPAVDSMVVRIRKRPFPHHLENPDHYLRLVEIMFVHRRRKLKNTLLMGFMNLPGMQGITKEDILDVLHRIVDPPVLHKRPEELETAEVVNLSNALVSEFGSDGSGPGDDPLVT